ncbi:MAG: DNA-binding response regulator [Gammaproteobacteria bacterium]
MKDYLLIALLLVIMTGSLYDFVVDSARGASGLHLAVEGFIFLFATVLIIRLLGDLQRQRRALEQLRLEVNGQPVAETPASPEHAETRHQLGSLIQQQFMTWELTDSEQAVGLLLLKGLSFREIAAVRETREKTVRAQASAIYRKAGVSGRHAFAAWFIEDFL